MSWQIGCFVILALVLLGGFAWYERSRPPAQIVALVAALAALAVAGRVAFPVIPNVVATTDIVFFCGYAIGGAPGFVVGALAGLVSNFWLGQGPWTPWQMAGWGMCGIGGAGLAALSGRRLGRFGLAAACGIAGLAYGALLDFSLMATYGGEQSLDRFLAISARSVPFNIAHVLGNVAIALAAGPAMVRMLIRFRDRFEVHWRPQPAIPLALVALSLGALSGSVHSADAAGSAVAWLRGTQNADGGFGANPGDESNPGMTGWAALGIEAAGINPLDLGEDGQSPISYLRANAADLRSVGDLERTVLVLRGAGLRARAFGGRDLVSELRRHRGADGSFAGAVNLTAFGVLALEAAGSKGGNSRSAAWLRAAQNADGGWGLAPRTASDADSTGAALQALAAAGGGSALRKGVSYLRGAQRPGGGFALAFGGPVNSQSTAWAVQGLVAAGVAPDSLRRGGTPFGYLRARAEPDGHYRYSASSDQTPVWVTGQALLAVDRKPFPLSPVERSTTAGSKSGAATAPAAANDSPAPSKAPNGGTEVPSAAAPATGGTSAAPAALAAEAPRTVADDDSGPSPALLAAGGVAAACALAGGGWLLYRRRLP